VDRRFDRARYDGQRTVDAFAEQLRNEVDVHAAQTALVATTERAMQPRFTGVWLRAAGNARSDR
jgi:hypothetical protein